MHEQNKRGVRCPDCGSGDWVSILYGLPTPSLQRQHKAGEIELGGAAVNVELPVYRCRSCGSGWGRLGDFLVIGHEHD